MKDFWKRVLDLLMVFLLPMMKPYIGPAVRRGVRSMWEAIEAKDANVAVYAALSMKGVSQEALMTYASGTHNEYDDLVVTGIIDGCADYLGQPTKPGIASAEGLRAAIQVGKS